MAPYSWNGTQYSKVCMKCGIEYPLGSDPEMLRKALLEAFNRNPATSDGCDSRCKLCRRGTTRTYRIVGLSMERILQLVEEQQNKCGICEREFPARQVGNGYHVDHCHKTSKLRGLLCNRCNVLMAAVDNKPWLEKALAYAKKHE